jgi:hypothetical protein
MLEEARMLSQAGADVRAFGAAGDGSTDDTTAVQRAIDSLAESGGTVHFPPGRYRVGALHLRAGVSLQGTYTFASLTSGSWLYCIDREAPALTLQSGTSVQSLGFYYPEQHWDHARSAPAHPYPPSVYVEESAKRILLRDVYFANTYEAIDVDRHHEYLILQNVQGYAIHRGIVEDFSSDIDRWTTVHFNYNCYWIAGDPDQELFAAWTRKHGTAFTIRRTDWLVMFDCFCWGYRTGIRLEDSPAGHGAPGGVHIVCCGFDACGACIDMTGGWGVRVSDSFFVSFNHHQPGTDTDAAAVMVTGGGEFGLKNCRWWGCDRGAALLECSNSVIEGNGFMDFGRRGEHEQGTEHAALVLGRGLHQVNNNQFSGVRFHNTEEFHGDRTVPGARGIEVRESAGGAVISGNVFMGLDKGSVRIDGDASRIALQANLHRDSAPQLTATGGDAATSDITLRSAR